jgi:hypothetical protein
MNGHLAFPQTGMRCSNSSFDVEVFTLTNDMCSHASECPTWNMPTTRSDGPIPSIRLDHTFQILAMRVLGSLARTKSDNMSVVVATDLFTKRVIMEALPVHSALLIVTFCCKKIV